MKNWKSQGIYLILTAFGFLSQAYAQDSLTITRGEEILDRYAISYGDTTEQIKQGKVTARYAFDKSKVAVEKYYLNGRQNGQYKSYFPDGGLMEFGVYANGKRNGEWTWYDKEGKIVIKGKFKDNVRHGFWAYKELDCFGRYGNGLKEGKWICYENGVKVKYYYKHGMLKAKR